MDGSKTKKKERERENGRESRSYASWETNRIGYAITLLRTDRRPRGDSFFADIYIFVSSFFFFFHASRIDSPFFHSCEQLEAILAIFVLFCFFFSFPVIGHVSFNTIIESSRERGSSLGTSSPPPFEFRMSRF